MGCILFISRTGASWSHFGTASDPKCDTICMHGNLHLDYRLSTGWVYFNVSFVDLHWFRSRVVAYCAAIGPSRYHFWRRGGLSAVNMLYFVDTSLSSFLISQTNKGSKDPCPGRRQMAQVDCILPHHQLPYRYQISPMTKLPNAFYYASLDNESNKNQDLSGRGSTAADWRPASPSFWL